MSRTESGLLAEADALCRDPRFRQSILRHCPFLDDPADVERFSTRIHRGDQMLVHSLRHHGHAGAALSQYFNIALQQHAAAQQVMRSSFAASDPTLRVLDFACGYGRLLRFLCLAIPRSRLWASELQSDAVTFVAHEFDVQVLASHADPARFQPGQRFDFIWVASLFSHLPEKLFHAWLQKLMSLLTTRGVLGFSVRDSALLPASRSLPASGILYDAVSENADLDSANYGTTFASEYFVRAALQRAMSGAHPCVRLPRALAHEQDLYVVAKDPARVLSALAQFRRGAWGWVDRRTLSSAGRLELEGWAASLDHGAVEHVEIIVDGIPNRIGAGLPRADVSAAFEDSRMSHAGWRFECDMGRDTRAAFVEVSARMSSNESSLLFAGIIEAEAA